MRPLPSPLLRGSFAAVTVATALTLSACGDDPQTSDAKISTPAAIITTPTTPPTTGPAESANLPEPSTPVATPSGKQETGDFSEPAAARGDDLPKVDRTSGLTLASDQGAKLKWQLRARTATTDEEDAFCVSLTTPSPSPPNPSCNSGTLLALQFFSDQATGHALATVDQAPTSKRTANTWLVVSGVAAADVDQVVVRYAGHSYPAKLTSSAARVPVDRQLAKDLTGATKDEIARLPGEVTVRAFAVAIPKDSGNPPADAVPRTLAPVKGKLTLDLQ